MLNTLIYHNLHRVTGTNYFWVKRAFFVAIVLFLLAMEVKTGKDMQPLGLEFLGKMSYLLFFLFLTISPVSFANSFLEERKKNVLGILLLTGLSPLQIISIKAFSRVFTMIFYLLGTLPIFMVCFSFGGISAEQIMYVFIILLSCIFFSGNIGLLCSILGFNSAYIGTIVSFIIYAIFSIYNSYGTISLNSLQSLHMVMQGETEAVYSGILIELCFSMVLFLISVRMLPKQIFAISKPRARTTKKGIRGSIEDKLWLQNKSVLVERQLRTINFTNPVAWKDYYFFHYPKITNPNKPKSCFGVGCLVSIFLMIFHIYLFIVVIFVLALLIAGLKTFGQESKGFETLLMTNLSNKDIIKGKLYAAYKGLAWFVYYIRILCFILLFLLLATFVFTYKKQLIVFLAILLGIPHFISACAFVLLTAMFYSFYCSETYRALIYSVVTIFLCQTILYSGMVLIPSLGIILIPIVNSGISYFLYAYMVKNLRGESFIRRFHRE